MVNPVIGRFILGPSRPSERMKEDTFSIRTPMSWKKGLLAVDGSRVQFRNNALAIAMNDREALTRIAARTLRDPMSDEHLAPGHVPGFSIGSWSNNRVVGVFFYGARPQRLIPNWLGVYDSQECGVVGLDNPHSAPDLIRVVDALALAANVVQELVMMRLFEAKKSPTWPPCPSHLGRHPLTVDTANSYDDVGWICPRYSGSVRRPFVASIGALGGPPNDR
jgi:hypothetical protein